jgi:A/G-specific adenine glycosylase
MTVPAFKKIVWKYYADHGRHGLPWRKTTNPYRILVSEIMLQQTQVERVIPFYRAWIKKYPTLQKLSEATLGDVLRQWQGLGYNRRAKMLHAAAQTIMRDYKGTMPKSIAQLESLPGIGHYTARAVMAFAHNKEVVFVETNLRTVVLHHFFPKQHNVTDADIMTVLEKSLVKGRAREWYAALMDYGSHLKSSGVRTNHRVKTYTKQSTFEGSTRQVRGAIIRALSAGSLPSKKLEMILGLDSKVHVVEQIQKLQREGMIAKSRTRYSLP